MGRCIPLHRQVINTYSNNAVYVEHIINNTYVSAGGGTACRQQQVLKHQDIIHRPSNIHTNKPHKQQTDTQYRQTETSIQRQTERGRERQRETEGQRDIERDRERQRGTERQRKERERESEKDTER